jgi:nitrogenase subunit NifH
MDWLWVFWIVVLGLVVCGGLATALTDKLTDEQYRDVTALVGVSGVFWFLMLLAGLGKL